MTRIDAKFADLQAAGKKAFVSYIMAGDPDYDTALEIMQGLPEAGVDIIELGVPFTDPMADGPTIQLAGQRALAAGMTLSHTLEMATEFRKSDDSTPIVLMGYYNPIYNRGVDTFLADAKAAGIDGLIVVDLPPEEDDELCIPAQRPGSTLSVWRRPRPMTSACPRFSPTPAALSITSRSPGSPAPLPPRRLMWPPKWPASRPRPIYP